MAARRDGSSDGWGFLRRRSGGRADTDPRSDVLLAIRRAQDEQRLLAGRAASALVNQGEVQRAVQAQLTALAGVRAQIRRARAAAERAAGQARVESGPHAAVPYEQTAQLLQNELRTIDTAIAQLDHLHGAARDNAERARALLLATGNSLQAALREQVRILARLERLGRERDIASAMLQAHQGRGDASP